MPSISLCMIVRDEADLIEACLASCVGAVDEVVVVDTAPPGGGRPPHRSQVHPIHRPGGETVLPLRLLTQRGG